MDTERRPTAEAVEDLQQRQRTIGREIRRLYEATVTEPVPSQLLDLLHQLETKEKRDAV